LAELLCGQCALQCRREQTRFLKRSLGKLT
jgi:hypothetical protein